MEHILFFSPGTEVALGLPPFGAIIAGRGLIISMEMRRSGMNHRRRMASVTEAIDMKRWLMDILACPASDCRSQLDLEVYTSHNLEADGEDIEEIDEALITCPKCGRWYPVIDGIACMLPDDQRMDGKQRKEETAFLERWRDRISSDIIENGIPFNLSSKE